MGGEQLRDLVLGKLTPEESLRVLDEVERSPENSADLDFYVDFARFVQEEGREVFGDVAQRVEGGWRYRLWGLGRRLREPRVTYGVVGGVAALVLMVMGVSGLVVDPMHDAGRVEAVAYIASVRGPVDEEIEIAQRLFEGGRRDEAIAELERYIRVHPGDDMGGYVRYLAGAMYLAGAERSTMGLFVHYDRDAVARGYAHLSVVDGTTTNARLHEEVVWLEAKALLMLGKRAEAAGVLSTIGAGRGIRSGAADSLRAVLEGGR